MRQLSTLLLLKLLSCNIDNTNTIYSIKQDPSEINFINKILRNLIKNGRSQKILPYHLKLTSLNSI